MENLLKNCLIKEYINLIYLCLNFDVLNMMRKGRDKKSWNYLIMPVVALITYGFTEIGARKPQLVETIYAQTIYPFVATFLSSVSDSVPFSLDDIFYLLLIFMVPVLVVLLLLKKISVKFSVKFVLNVLATSYVLFYILWGFNYFREELSQRLDIHERQANDEQFVQIFEKIIEDTNHSFCSFDNFDKSEIDSLVEKSYKELASALKIKYPAGKRKDKSITFSNFFAKTGISGYYGPFFNEVHVNRNVMSLEYPVVLAHEKAHQFGITSEAEANFYAWLVCVNSNSPQLQYSANLFVLRYFLYQSQQLEEYQELVSKIDQPVKDDFNSILKHWMELRNEQMDKAASKMNDAYLKGNKVEKGIKDYRGVVKHVMNFSLDSTFQQRHSIFAD